MNNNLSDNGRHTIIYFQTIPLYLMELFRHSDRAPLSTTNHSQTSTEYKIFTHLARPSKTEYSSNLQSFRKWRNYCKNQQRTKEIITSGKAKKTANSKSSDGPKETTALRKKLFSVYTLRRNRLVSDRSVKRDLARTWLSFWVLPPVV